MRDDIYTETGDRTEEWRQCDYASKTKVYVTCNLNMEAVLHHFCFVHSLKEN